jgi:hypothetical protein
MNNIKEKNMTQFYIKLIISSISIIIIYYFANKIKKKLVKII